MSWAELEVDDDDLLTGKTPRPEELPSLVREHHRLLRIHHRQHREFKRLVWAVILTVLAGSLGVAATVAQVGVSLGARMERLESVADRVGRLERITER